MPSSRSAAGRPGLAPARDSHSGLRASLARRAAAAAACLALAAPAGSAAGGRRLRMLPPRPASATAAGFVPGELLVKLRPGAAAAKAEALARMGLERAERIEELGVERYVLPAGADVEREAAAVRAMPGVEFAEPNYLVAPAVVPNDQYYAGYQGYSNDLQRWTFGGVGGDASINAEAAWDVTTGRRDVTIAVIDSGVSFTLDDLARNIWTNDGEVPGNGRDDDGNGYADDFNGWDFIYNDADPRPDLGNNRDDDGSDGPDTNTFHGSFAASCAAARGNDGSGVCGAAWACRVMPLKVFADDGTASSFQIAAALRYAADMGADVANLSLSSPVGGETLAAGVAYALARDVVVVAAAGNYNSSELSYPAGFEGVLAVGASGHAFQLPLLVRFWQAGNLAGRAPYSQWGTAAVDVVAPGTLFAASVASAADAAADPTTKAGDPVGLSAAGTSFSSPIVAGLAALIVSLDRDRHAGVRTLTASQVGGIIMSTARDLPDDPLDYPDAGDRWDGRGRVDFLAALGAVPAGGAGRAVRIGWRPPVAAGPSPAPADLRVLGDSAQPGAHRPGPVTTRTGPVPPAVVAYKVYRGGALVATVPGSRLAFVDSGAPDGELTYTVRAVYAVSESAASEPASTAATPPPQGPRVLSPALAGDKLSLAAAGSGVADGALLVVNGTTSFPLAAKGGTKWLVKKPVTGSPSGATIAQAIPAGRPVTLQVINPDGSRSAEVEFQR